MKKHNVLIIEDIDSTRERLAAVIDRHAQCRLQGAVATVQEAENQLDRRMPDLMLVDIDLPDGSGIDIIKNVHNRGFDTESIVITVHGDEKHVVAALEAGATGYLLKDGREEHIGESITQLLEGGSPISPGIARYLLKRFQAPPKPIPENVEPPHLTKREIEVLNYLTKGFSYAEIADILHMSAHTVTTHIKHIYRKLAVKSRSEAVYEAAQLGIVKM